MDPEAAYRRYRDAMKAGDFAEAREARQDLLDWIRKGGFEPKWSKALRHKFLKGTGVRKSKPRGRKYRAAPASYWTHGTIAKKITKR